MSNTTHDSGPVFPVAPAQLRDWFAGQAMQGWLASYPEQGPHPASDDTDDTLARYSYAMADAMLRARNAQPSMEPKP